MKIILGNEEIKKIIEGYAYSEFPTKEPEVCETEDSCEPNYEEEDIQL